jgi:CubicO group peptidase (beta-lactamase class C family)
VPTGRSGLAGPVALTIAALLTATAGAVQHPPFAGDWPVATPESEGIDSGTLAEMLDYVHARQLPVHSILLLRHGRIVMDATLYPFEPGRPHDIASVTKSVTSLLIGIALDKGYLTSVKQRVPELLSLSPAVKLDSRKERLSVEHLLTMTSGLDCKEDQLADMRRSADWVQFALALPMAAEPGTRFSYCSCNNHLLSAILSVRTGDNALAFAQKHLFAPLGIQDAVWPADPRGRTHGWGDLHLHPRDLAKIAYLYRQGGRWNGTQVVSEEWVRQSTAPRVSVRDGVGYGYSWWINTTRQPPVFEAEGRGGQRAAVVPDKDLVVVFTGGGVNTDELAPFLFRAIQSDTKLRANTTGAARLREALARAGQPPPSRVADPLPELAARISGRTYAFEPNRLNLQRLSLAFRGRSEGRAILRIDNRDWDVLVGLDDRYRFTVMGPERSRVATGGRWLSPQEFLLDLNTVAGINHFTFRIQFLERGVDVQIDEVTGEVRNLRVRGRVAEGGM